MSVKKTIKGARPKGVGVVWGYQVLCQKIGRGMHQLSWLREAYFMVGTLQLTRTHKVNNL